MQALCTLPAPPSMIWRYPGFPSLFVTYSVGNDYFFSGHTAIAVFGAMELARLRRRWLTALALLVVLFEVATVLILRAHYTMDVFTGAVVALWVSALCNSVAPRVDRLISTSN
jgi:membrane-associated phospholipid phosphatase